MAQQQRAYRQYDSRGGIVNEASSPAPPTSVKGMSTSSSSNNNNNNNNNNQQQCDDGSCLRSDGQAYSQAQNVEEGAVEEAENDFSIHDGPVGAVGASNTNIKAPTDNTTSNNTKTPPTLEPYVGKLERYELFSTAQCYYLVACDKAGTGYRVLKMDRTLIERPDATSQARRVELEKRRREEQDAAAAVATSASGGGDGMGAVGATASSSGNKSGMFPATNPAASSDGGASAAAGGGGPIDSPHGPNAHIRPLCEFCIEDPAVYSQDEIRDMLDMIHEGNKYTPGYDAPHGVGSGGSSGHAAGPGGHPRERPGGGLRPICKAYGVVGFVRFLDCYYLTLITKRAKVGSLGGNGIYTIKATETFPLKPAERPGQAGSGGGGGVSAGPIDFDRAGRDPTGAADGGKDPGTMLLSMWNRGKRSVGLGLTNREIAELRYQGLYQVVDLTKNFYFSYTYDVTRSLQENFLATKSKPFPPPPFKDMYAWNYFLTKELEQCTNSMTSFQWVMPIIHGAFLQRRLNDYGRSMNLTLLARRSRHFAGTRYLKRGVSDQGKVANDVEHEQILHDEASSASAGAFSSYLQCRGSIPTYWTQESSVTLPKPPIVLNRVDPTYHATQAHFGDLLRRYGSPIVVVDLVKQSEKREREVIVGNEFRSAIDHLN